MTYDLVGPIYVNNDSSIFAPVLFYLCFYFILFFTHLLYLWRGGDGVLYFRYRLVPYTLVDSRPGRCKNRPFLS